MHARVNIVSGEQENVYFLWGWNQTVQGCFFLFSLRQKPLNLKTER